MNTPLFPADSGANATASDLERAMIAQANPADAEILQHFFKTGPGQYGEGDKFLGCKNPVTRRTAKAFRALPVREAVRAAHSEWHEVRLCALLVLLGHYESKKAGEKERKPGEPVEIAGRKINPLILSLETGNTRLFKLLMENKADPNVVNEKKVSALMLAIANNDSEQVKLLLEAGAKVTSDAARAGTASGVNAEIVNLMKSYLPGVRHLDAPEKKQTGSASKKTDAAGSAKRKTP